MNAGFENFSYLYNQRISDPIAWDINQLTSEQQALQEIHEEYIGDTWIFRYVGEVFTGVDITDYDSRINYGCSLLGLSKEQGCK